MAGLLARMIPKPLRKAKRNVGFCRCSFNAQRSQQRKGQFPRIPSCVHRGKKCRRIPEDRFISRRHDGCKGRLSRHIAAHSGVVTTAAPQKRTFYNHSATWRLSGTTWQIILLGILLAGTWICDLLFPARSKTRHTQIPLLILREPR
jgi:hypothetical protein